jgi:hypothetical protein
MTAASVGNGLRRTTGALLLGGALAFAGAATVLSSTFDWPDVLREPAAVVLPAFTVSAIYLLNQGDVLATAVPGFPVWDLAGLLGSTGWGLWVAALGGTVLLWPVRADSPTFEEDPTDSATVPSPRQSAAAGVRS